jgi:hypothetical protein
VSGTVKDGTRRTTSPSTASGWRLAAGGEVVKTRAGPEQGVSQRGDRVDQVLAVVEQEEHGA